MYPLHNPRTFANTGSIEGIPVYFIAATIYSMRVLTAKKNTAHTMTIIYRRTYPQNIANTGSNLPNYCESLQYRTPKRSEFRQYQKRT